MVQRKYRYVTNRSVGNNAGEKTGKIRVFVKVGSDTAGVDYVCPECSNSDHTEKEWKRPFSVKCSKCGFLIRLPRMKDEMKREKRMARKKK